MRNPIVLKRIGDAEPLNGSLLRRAFRRFRLPLRQGSEIEQLAARNRAERLFEVNFRTSWTR
ncbi:MAG TPA: hypothetical protein VHY22_02515 [Chthoniobacteraceae bacterium]|jgi:hypothetical protein|nr:hypothetical protein [Chthoniobacteraceae bacterium]